MCGSLVLGVPRGALVGVTSAASVAIGSVFAVSVAIAVSGASAATAARVGAVASEVPHSRHYQRQHHSEHYQCCQIHHGQVREGVK